MGVRGWRELSSISCDKGLGTMTVGPTQSIARTCFESPLIKLESTTLMSWRSHSARTSSECSTVEFESKRWMCGKLSSSGHGRKEVESCALALPGF